MTTPAYARKTSVTQDRTRSEIERLVTLHKATKFASGWNELGASVAFELQRRRVRFELLMPEPTERRFTHPPTKGGANPMKARSAEAARRAYEQECRARWRSLYLIIKAKLEAVRSGITTFDVEFSPYIILPNGKTIGEWVAPQIEKACADGKMPLLLGAGASS